MSLRILIVDDSASYASLIKQVVEGVPGVEVIGRSPNGRDALQRIRADAPDLVTLDLEMPGMSGIEVLRAMRKQSLGAPVVVLRSATGEARGSATEAAQLGALDFLAKPEGPDIAANLAALRAKLDPLVSAVKYRKEVRTLLHGDEDPPAAPAPAPAARPSIPTLVSPTPSEAAGEAPGRSLGPITRVKPVMVVIGASTGGTEALARVIPILPADLRVPVLIVQHMPPFFTENFAGSLDARSLLEVHEARNGEIAQAGHVYIAPGGSHLKVMAGARQEIVLRITSDPPENNCRPAVDYLFRSAATAFPGAAVAVILTGMGRDGTSGLRLLKNSGCVSIAQNETTCAVFGMPKEAIQAGVVDLVAPIDSIASAIVRGVERVPLT